MASLMNAVRNIYSDNYWLIKIIVLSAPLFLILSGKLNSDQSNIILFLFVVIINCGCSSFLMNRNINNNYPILPSLFSIPEVLIKTICSTIVMLPASFILYVLITFINQNIVFESFIMFIIYFIVIVIMSPFIVIPGVLYSVRGKISDALKMKLIFQGAGNFSVAFMSFLLQYVFSILLFSYLICIFFKQMLGEDTILIQIIQSIVFTFSFLCFFSYCSDLYEDVIPAIKSKSDIF